MSDLHARFEPGPDPALVMVHGMGGDFSCWDGMVARLGRDRATLRYDLRGFGQSPAPDGPYSHGADLIALLDAHGIDRCDLMGVSMGGGVALNVALDRPDRVRRLILISPAPVAWQWSDDWTQRWRAVTTLARAEDLASAKALWRAHPMFATLSGPAADAFDVELARYGGLHWLGRDSHEPRLPDIDRLPDLAVPTLLLTGARDVPDFRLIADLIEGAAPDVRRIDFADAGHLVHKERLNETAQAIDAFLR